MTTIIVVVVVALVFFVAVCVVTFMVWKRESEMRTDSIRAIEENLERLTQGLSADTLTEDAGSFADRKKDGRDISYMDAVIAESMPVKPRKKRSYDPFGWVRDEENTVRSDKENEALEALREKAAEPEENTEYKDGPGDIIRGSVYAAGQNEPEELPGEPVTDVPVAVRPEEVRYEEDIGIREDGVDGLNDSHDGFDGLDGFDSLDDSEDFDDIEDLKDIMEIGLREHEVPGESQAPQEKEQEEVSDSISDNIADIRKLIAEYGEDEERSEDQEAAPVDEISLDFIDKMDCEAEENDTEDSASHRQQMGYDVGRSGKKYTASELETLIKE